MRSSLKIRTSWTAAVSALLNHTRLLSSFPLRLSHPECLLQVSVFLPLILCSGFGFSAQDWVQCAWYGDSCGTDAHQVHHRTGGLQSTAGQGEATPPPSGHVNHKRAALTEQMWLLVCRKSFSRTTCTQTRQFVGSKHWLLPPGCLDPTANTKRWA